MKNKKGQTMSLAILSALAVFICGFMFINFLMPEVTQFRTDIGCSSIETLSDGAKLLCLGGDLTIPLVILAILSLAVGAVTSRLNL
jgi:hypothetical protein